MEREASAGNKRVPLRKLPSLDIVGIEFANNDNILYACNHWQEVIHCRLNLGGPLISRPRCNVHSDEHRIARTHSNRVVNCN